MNQAVARKSRYLSVENEQKAKLFKNAQSEGPYDASREFDQLGFRFCDDNDGSGTVNSFVARSGRGSSGDSSDSSGDGSGSDGSSSIGTCSCSGCSGSGS
eukprot:Pgem_evm1s7103